jgi:hypothetical protein
MPLHDGRPPYFMPDVITEARRLLAFGCCTPHEIAEVVAEHVYEDLMLELLVVPDAPPG